MNRLRNQRGKGFTLVEIMIVVLIIGILLSIALPNFIKARETSRTKSCISNLRQVDAAKEQWAMDNNAANGSAIPGGMATLVGNTNYLKRTPTCPTGGTYTIGNIGTSPTCSLAAQGHVF
jgi:prepilin-type N-terminal cleavage/methylation domain-containing protein